MSIKLNFDVWVDGTLKAATIECARDKYGRFLTLREYTQGYPARLVDTGEKGVLRQDEQAKLYFVQD